MGKSQADAARLASDEDEYDKTFFVPERARWSNLNDLKHDIGPSRLRHPLSEHSDYPCTYDGAQMKDLTPGLL